MSYTLFSETPRTARKQHRCIWCPEKIEVGQKYIDERSAYVGAIQRLRWHQECRFASAEYFKEDDEFSPHSFKRGTLEEA